MDRLKPTTRDFCRPGCVFVASLCLVAFVGCGDDADVMPAAPDAAAASDVDAGPPPPRLDDPALPADSAPLRRMTNRQFENAVRDLFAPLSPWVTPGALPPELAIRGLENNAAVNTATPGLAEAWFTVTTEVAEQVAAEFDAVSDCSADDATCVRAWFRDFVPRAWRRPVEARELDEVIAVFDEQAARFGARAATELTLIFVLLSPDFLYFPEFGGAPVPGSTGVPLTAYEVASRLSVLLWNSVPDARLLQLAASGALLDRDVVAAEAWRMLADDRAHDAVLNFYRQHLDFDAIGSNSLDFETYFGGNEDDSASDFLHIALQPAMRIEAEVFIDRHVFEREGTLASLLTSTQTWVTPDLADTVYGVDVDTGRRSVSWFSDALVFSEFELEDGLYPLRLDPMQRAGVLTMAGFLNAHGKPIHPSPVLRGVFVMERFLCTTPPPPPDDVPPLDEGDDVEIRTNRDRYAHHTSNPACASCHLPIDGAGFPFEIYDSLGRYRTTDNGYPVDASGQLIGTDVDRPVSDAVDLAHLLASSRTVHDCHVTWWVRHALGRDVTLEDRELLERLQDGFWASGGDIPELIVNIAASHSFRHRSVR